MTLTPMEEAPLFTPVFLIVLAIAVAIFTICYIIAKKRDSDDLIFWFSILSLGPLCVIGGISSSLANAELREQWGGDFQAWAAETYDMDFSDEEVRELTTNSGAGLQCESGTECHYIDLLIDSEVQRIEFVWFTGTPALLADGRELERR